MAEENGNIINRPRRIYSTKVIEQLIKDKSEGYDIDYAPFFERDLKLRASNITFEMTKEEMDEYEKCYNDPLYFIEHYCKFKIDDNYALANLRSYQKKIIKIVTDDYYDEESDNIYPKNKNIIWMASRQVGKTTTLGALLVTKMTFTNNYNILIVSNKEKSAKEVVAKITEVIKELPFFLKPGCINVGQTGIKFENGSQITISATTNTASIGFTINFVLLDEFAHVPENIVNNFWRSVYPTLSASKISQCMIISTPNGTTNKFYDVWSNSIAGKNSFVNMRTDYWEVPGRDEAWAAQTRADFGDEEFAQEFELQFNKNSKMIMKASDMAFTEKLIVDYIPRTIYKQNQYLEDSNLTWHPDFNPNVINPYDKFVIIVDLAEGNGDPNETFQSKKKKTPDANSFTIFRMRLNSPANLRRFSGISCTVKDCVRLEQIGKFQSSSEDEIYLAKVCSAVCYNLFGDQVRNNVRVIVEMNFNGKAFLEEFKHHSQYSGSTILKTYHKKPIPGESQKRKYGIKTTQNKEYYCLKGNKLISRRRTIITERDTFEQMKSFGYVRGHLMGISCHDDLSLPVFNHIPRAFDENSFISWIEEYIYNHPDRNKVYILNNIIQRWAIDNPDMSDDDFEALYGVDQQPGMTGGPMMDQYGGYVELGGYIPVGEVTNYGDFGNNGYGPALTADNYNSLI